MSTVYRPEDTHTVITVWSTPAGGVCSSTHDEPWADNNARIDTHRGSIVAVVPPDSPPGTASRLADHHIRLRERANGIAA